MAHSYYKENGVDNDYLSVSLWQLDDSPFAEGADPGNPEPVGLNDNWRQLTDSILDMHIGLGFDAQAAAPDGTGEQLFDKPGIWVNSVDKRLHYKDPDDADHQIATMTDINNLDPQESVIDFRDFTADEPAAPNVGDRYVNTATGVSSVTAQAVTVNYIYQWNGADWTEIIPDQGTMLADESTNTIKYFDGASWLDLGAVVAHNSTSGKQGGNGTDEMFHLDEGEWNELTDWMDNIDLFGDGSIRFPDTVSAIFGSNSDTLMSFNVDIFEINHAANTVRMRFNDSGEWSIFGGDAFASQLTISQTGQINIIAEDDVRLQDQWLSSLLTLSQDGDTELNSWFSRTSLVGALNELAENKYPASWRDRIINFYDFFPDNFDGWLQSVSGAGATVSKVQEVGLFGVVTSRLVNPNAVGDWATFSREGNNDENIVIGHGVYSLEMKVRSGSNLSTGAGADQFWYGSGLMNWAAAGTTWADTADAVMFVAKWNGSAVEWYAVTVTGGAYSAGGAPVTETATGILLAVDTDYDLEIVVNAAGNSIAFLIDGNPEATHTTDIPATTTYMTIFNGIHRVGVGTLNAQRNYYLDAVYEKYELTTPR